MRGAGRLPGKVQRTRKPKATRKASAARSAVDRPEEELVERLKRERDEAFELQAASAAVLRIISSSTGQLQPVFDTMLQNAVRICEAKYGNLFLVDGDTAHWAAGAGTPAEISEFFTQSSWFRPTPRSHLDRVMRTKQLSHAADDTAEAVAGVAAAFGGARSTVCVPMLKDDALIGAIFIYRTGVRPFTTIQIELLKNFADQAVIAIENTRLLEEVQARTRDLEESLQQQTATSEVLQIISSSPGDLTPVFDKMLENATRVCGAEFGSMYLVEDDSLRQAALYNVPAALAAARTNKVFRPHPQGQLAAAIRTRQAVQVADVRTTAAYLEGIPNTIELADLGGARTLIVVPMLREDQVIGAITIYRQEVRPFADKQIELVRNFAKQAVIAIENARLLTETREALERQTATTEVLQVINSSQGDLQPVFETILEKAHGLCAVAHGGLLLYDGERFRAVASRGLPEALAAHLREGVVPGPNTPHQRLLEGARFVQVTNWAEIDHPVARASLDADVRTTLFVPLRREGKLLGYIAAARREVRPFNEKEIALLESFAAQAVIAMENARLLTETSEALERQTATTEVLQVINSSPGDLEPVFDAILVRAHSLCGVAQGSLQLYDGSKFRAVAVHGLSDAFADRLRQGFSPNTLGQRLLGGERFVHIPDLSEIDDPMARVALELSGVRTVLFIPLHKDGILLGRISASRPEVKPFTEKEIMLLESFAAQAVIAIENARLITETREALEQQTATAEVLQVINSSPGYLAPVFDAMLEKALTLCGAAFGQMVTFDGVVFRAAAWRGYEPGPGASAPSPGMALYQLVHGEQIIHIPDITDDDVYRSGNPVRRRLADEYGGRTAIWVALRKDAALLGAFVMYRTEVRPFSDKQIALLRNFAAQAVIAMENARLLDEIRHRNDELAEALEYQTATSEVLRIVAGSPENLQSVFDAMLEKAIALCGAKFGTLFLYDGKVFTAVADRNLPSAHAQVVRGQSFSPEANSGFRRLVESMAPLHIRDLSADPSFAEREPLRTAAVELGGVRSLLAVPLLKKGELIGNFSIYGGEPGGFAENQIALVSTFADQAVIAIENARLLGELRQRTADLARSVDELTATGDVLKIISRSSVDLETVLDTLVDTVARLCRADQTAMYRQRDDKHHLVASRGSQEAKEFFLAHHPGAHDRGTTAGRVAVERRVVHIPDALQDPNYTYPGQKVLGYRTMLGIPLLREETLLGIFVVSRTRVEPFTDKEIELATTFADQAVIAIENARLFEELRGRQAELRVTFDNMGDGVAMFGADTRLVAWNRNFQTIVDLPDTLVEQRPTFVDFVRFLAERGEFGTDDIEGELHRRLQDTDRELRLERTRPDGRVIEVRRSTVPGGGFVLIYGDVTERKRAEQAIRAARDAAETALRDLQAAQASLVHAQKMAALGQLTAGIAHEIKNPLNFVNNFAGLSVELLEELKGATAEAIGALDSGKRAEVLETIGILTGNLEKIAEHGRRADGIVRGMLQHSRGSSGDWQTTDLNALVEESSNLAYHGARAQDQDFKVTLELDLDRNLAPIEVVSQDVSRVLLNLISNGFYAIIKRGREGDGTFRPALKITTRDFAEGIEIRVRDNGVGIPVEYHERLFQPFFTTKPTGEGTGLGLSISYEIVTQQHGGTITVNSEVGDFTEFTVRLPRRRHAVA